jgi:uncharacterized repeat protein (TIGR03843 family)
MDTRKVDENLAYTEVMELLLNGTIDLQGQFVLGSNYTFLVNLQSKSSSIQAVYKPQKGEVPLWDFPPATLAARETAAFIVSEMLEWNLVPPTAIREDGPFGEGSFQLFIPHNPDLNYFTFGQKTRQRLKPTVLFDLILNNADRKGSHIILDENRHIWLIDHGLCFHPSPKYRTVIWDFSGESIESSLILQLQNLTKKLSTKSELNKNLQQLLDKNELDALKSRIEFIVDHPVFPMPDENKRQFPWPLV